MLVAVPSNHRLAKNRSLSIEDLANEPLVFYPRVERPQGFTDYLMRMFHSRNITPNIVQDVDAVVTAGSLVRSDEHTSELQSLMSTYDADFCLKKKTEKRQ